MTKEVITQFRSCIRVKYYLIIFNNNRESFNMKIILFIVKYFIPVGLVITSFSHFSLVLNECSFLK